MTTRANRIERYYDTHDVEGEELTQSFAHYAAIRYLIAVLELYFQSQNVGVASNINFYQTDQPHETPKSPDVVVVDGMVVTTRSPEDSPSYYVGHDGPAPRVAIEISSKNTWRVDLEEKPTQYASMGILEYFVFDPNPRSYWTKQWRQHNRLVGWRIDETNGQYVLLPKDSEGRIWSEQLQSWLVVDGQFLRLYTTDGQLRENADDLLLAERRQRQILEQQALAERARAEQAEQARLEAERRLAELTEQLRRLQAKPEE